MSTVTKGKKNCDESVSSGLKQKIKIQTDKTKIKKREKKVTKL